MIPLDQKIKAGVSFKENYLQTQLELAFAHYFPLEAYWKDRHDCRRPFRAAV
jgi:hypothetical protein